MQKNVVECSQYLYYTINLNINGSNLRKHLKNIIILTISIRCPVRTLQSDEYIIINNIQPILRSDKFFTIKRR